MAKLKNIALFLVLSLIAACAPALADDPTYEASAEAAAAKKGKTMAEFVNDAEGGFKNAFSDEEVGLVMTASRLLKKDNLNLSRKLERVASKMANFD